MMAGIFAVPVCAQHDSHAAPASETPAAPASAVADPHAGHDMNAMGSSAPTQREAAPPPIAFSGPAHAADTIFAVEKMARARDIVYSEHGNLHTYLIMADRLESHSRDNGDGYLWDAQGWYGGDLNKLWLKSEGEGSTGDNAEHAELQALWSHAIAPWWDIQAGVRHDFRPNPGQTHMVVGLQGLMPYKFALDAAAFLSEDGDFSTHLEAEYDMQITQRLILQPRVEMDMAAEDVPEIQIGSGITSAELGLRLRYEIAREFAPYVGLEYVHSFGSTADYARATGEDNGGWSLLVGVRAWF
jgi:copper resistance protein B